MRGTSGYVRPEQKIDEEVSGLYAKISSPVLVEVRMRVTSAQVEDILPATMPDLFAGTSL